jgi:hypothetical protein
MTSPGNVSKNANFAQKTYSETFSIKGDFEGRPIDDVAADLRQGKLTPKDVPIQYIVRDEHTLILNTRSSQVLERAGIPRQEWYVKDTTGDHLAEWRLDQQLKRSKLTDEGTPSTTGGKKP